MRRADDALRRAGEASRAAEDAKRRAVEAVRRAGTAGVHVTYREEQGLLHVYPILPVPEAKAALEDVVEFLR